MPLWAGDDRTRHNILRLLAYQRKDYDRSVVRISHEQNRAMDVVGFSYFPSLDPLGALAVLPVEMLNAILQFSDLSTISMFRLVNRRARAVVEAFAPYKLILIHAPHVVDILTRTGVACHFTTMQVFSVLCSPFCAVCGRFGAFLWIPECIRCCIPCVRKSHELMPMTERDAKAAFGVTPKTLAKVPIVNTLPGVYSLFEVPYKRKCRLLSQARARQVAVVVHGGEEGLITYINSHTSQAKAAYDKRVARRNTTRSAFDLQGNIHNTIDDISRFLVTTHLPYFDPIARSTQTGLSCKACQAALESASQQVLSSKQLGILLDQRDQTFTEDMFLEHFNNCMNAQRMWTNHRESNDTVL